MKETIKTLIVMTIIIFGFKVQAAKAQTAWQSDFYDQAGFLEIYEEEAVMVGSLAPDATLKFGLQDVALMMGHACPGTTSGFILTKMALEELFKGETIRWGNIRIAASGLNGIVNVASYLSGIHLTNLLADKPNLMIDKSLDNGKAGQLVMIFQRTDTGKMVKAEFNKMKLMSAEQMKAIKPYKGKFSQGKASPAEIETNGKLIQSIVKRAISEPPAGVYSVSVCSKYQFPAK
jgi:hypothetical protein